MRAFDISSTIPSDSWYGTLLKGTFNFQPDPSWLQVVAWIGYIVPVLFLYFSGSKTPASIKPTAQVPTS